MKAELQIDVTFEQILSLVKQLPRQDKLKLTQALEQDEIGARLSKLLDTFRSDEVDENTITEEVEIVRQELYDKQKR